MIPSVLAKRVLPLLVLVAFPAACALSGPSESETSDLGAGGSPTDPTGSSSTSGNRPNDPGQSEPECPHVGPPLIDPNILPGCDSCSSGGAHCVSPDLVPDEFEAQLDSCQNGDLCVPDPFIESGGRFIPATCASVAGAEGRCLSPCIPQVGVQAANLPQSSCGPTELCTPCYDPQTGDATGACDLSCDPGPTEPPTLLPPCCESDGQSYGTCVPKSAAGAQADRLGPDSCPQDGGDLVCAPNEYVADQNHQAPDCDDFFRAFTFGEEYGPGKCLSACIPEVADAPLTGAGDCDGDNVKCVPCISPLDGQSTGACDL